MTLSIRYAATFAVAVAIVATTAGCATGGAGQADIVNLQPPPAVVAAAVQPSAAIETAASDPARLSTAVPPETGAETLPLTPAEAPALEPSSDVPVVVMEAVEPMAVSVPPALVTVEQVQAPVVEHADLWHRIRAGFAMPDLKTPLVKEKERFYLAQPEYLQRMLQRSAPYLYFIVEELEKRNLPTELALLPFVESAMNPVALSHAKAAGLWQFIPATGKRYELSQDWWVDERRDVVRSTRAALEYLQVIHAMHGNDWFLALASYNWGENAVARAVKHNRARGMKTDYLSLKMPRETRHYVPKLIALKHIVMRPEVYGVALPSVPNAPYFVSITKSQPIDLALAAEFAGMDVKEFVALNPSHNRPVIAATGDHRIRIPVDRVDGFAQAMQQHVLANKPLASWQPYTVKPGETLADIARRGGIPTAELLRANGLSARGQVLPGSKMLAPQQAVGDPMLIRTFNGPQVFEQVTVPAAYHVVRKGETLTSIARRHRVSLANLKRWNGQLSSATAGTRLVVRPASARTFLTTSQGARPVARSAVPGAAPRPAPATGKPAAVRRANVTRSDQAVPMRAAPQKSTAPADSRSPAKRPVPPVKRVRT